MKLYLSSYRIPVEEELFKLVGSQPEDISVALIPNAQDYYAERARRVKLNQTIEYLREMGLTSELVDLRKHRQPNILQQKLKQFDLIWVVGGNTFCLRHEMKLSGFDEIIGNMIEKGLVYGGESAGACVVGNSLKGLETADDPTYAEETIWEGLNILPHFILPHTDNPMFATDIDVAREIHKNDNPAPIELTDSQALVINDDQQTIVDKPAE